MSHFPRGLQLLCAIPFALQACGGGGSTGPAPKPARLSNPDSTAAQLQSLTAPFETDAFLNFAARSINISGPLVRRWRRRYRQYGRLRSRPPWHLA